MALTANVLPFAVPGFDVPYDASLAFADPATPET